MRGSSSSLACAAHISHNLMRHLHALMLCVWIPRRLSLPLLAVHFPSCRLVHLPGLQLLLPGCGGQIPCTLSLKRTLAPLPSTTLSQIQTRTEEAAGNYWRDHLQLFKMLDPDEPIRTIYEAAGFIRIVSVGMHHTTQR